MAFNTGIAVTLTAFGNHSLAENLIYSQLIGVSIWALIDGGRHLIHPSGQITAQRTVVLTLFGVLLGYFLGSALGDVTLGRPALIGWQMIPQRMVGFLLLSLAAGTVLVYFFHVT
ncbi:MAG: hypothetical protein HC858_00595 [Brachymonas sp.]|nr:hypothetical protein [Brachymonas sp.]